MTGGEGRILGLRHGVARGVLLVSLALNFLVVGAYVGLSMRDEGRARSPSVFNQLAEVAGDDRKAEVSAILSERKKLWRDRRGQRTDDWSAIADHLASADFSGEGLQALLDEQGALTESSRRASRSAFVRAVSVLTAEERAAYADIIRVHVEKRKAAGK